MAREYKNRTGKRERREVRTASGTGCGARGTQGEATTLARSAASDAGMLRASAQPVGCDGQFEPRRETLADD